MRIGGTAKRAPAAAVATFLPSSCPRVLAGHSVPPEFTPPW
jgi:hypothetical protein